MSREYHQPTVRRCPKCGRENEHAFFWTVEEHESPPAPVPVSLEEASHPKNLTFDVVELEVFLPCGHGFPRRLMNQYYREARESELGIRGSGETWRELKHSARDIEESPEQREERELREEYGLE